ncbi:hypothetical protein I7I50_10808 [Histoplasma capsulatum G186AR]|uniref:Uncharacterized protein n=1 Tax=Ajellomyces capsulatus TaxID=5037 RepID=A0A8H8D7J6_AJECA|nr:hypothetical protein I7I52_02047 [Histoplasma capsulatum]QSS69502.1 hypothetical protein I7I50_10808 [Histoplasma capsulatum G186AR]
MSPVKASSLVVAIRRHTYALTQPICQREVGRGAGQGSNQGRKSNNRYIVSIHSLLLFQRNSRAEGGFDSPYPEIAASRTLFPSSTQSQRTPDLKTAISNGSMSQPFQRGFPFG